MVKMMIHVCNLDDKSHTRIKKTSLRIKNIKYSVASTSTRVPEKVKGEKSVGFPPPLSSSPSTPSLFPRDL